MEYWDKDKHYCILSFHNCKKTHHFDNKKSTLGDICHSVFHHLRLSNFYGLIIQENEDT